MCVPENCVGLSLQGLSQMPSVSCTPCRKPTWYFLFLVPPSQNQTALNELRTDTYFGAFTQFGPWQQHQAERRLGGRYSNPIANQNVGIVDGRCVLIPLPFSPPPPPPAWPGTATPGASWRCLWMEQAWKSAATCVLRTSTSRTKAQSETSSRRSRSSEAESDAGSCSGAYNRRVCRCKGSRHVPKWLRLVA